jgi:hypothetical protein
MDRLKVFKILIVFKQRQYVPLTATRKCPLNWIGFEPFYSNQTLLNVLYEIHETTNRQDAIETVIIFFPKG